MVYSGFNAFDIIAQLVKGGSVRYSLDSKYDIKIMPLVCRNCEYEAIYAIRQNDIVGEISKCCLRGFIPSLTCASYMKHIYDDDGPDHSAGG
jgi:hypothetical protein